MTSFDPSNQGVQPDKAFEAISPLKESGKKTRIYYNPEKNAFVLQKKSNFIVEFFRFISGSNYRNFTSKGFSSDSNKVLGGLQKNIEVIDNNVKAFDNKETKKSLKETLTKISKFVNRESRSPTSAKIKESVDHIFKTLSMKSEKEGKSEADERTPLLANFNVTHTPAPANTSAAATAHFSAASSSSSSEPVEVEIKLPEPRDYQIPTIEVKDNALGDFMIFRGVKQKRETQLSELQDAFKLFVEANKQLATIGSQIEKIQGKEQPSMAQPTSMGIPPPPSMGPPPPPPPPAMGPPPPPPPPGAAKQKGKAPATSWKEKQQNQWLNKDVKESPLVALRQKQIEAENTLKTSYNTIINTLFSPELVSKLKNNEPIDAKTIEAYVNVYQSQANAQIEHADKKIEENDPLKNKAAGQRGAVNPSDPLAGLPEGDRKEITSLSTQMRNIDLNQKNLEKIESKLKTNTANLNMTKDKLNILAKNYTEDKADEFKNLTAQRNSLEKDIEGNNQAIAKNKENFEKMKKNLAVQLNMKGSPNIDELKQAAQGKIDGIKDMAAKRAGPPPAIPPRQGQRISAQSRSTPPPRRRS